MKIFKHLREVRKNRVLPKINSTLIKYTSKPLTTFSETPHWEWEYTITFGCVLKGPEEAKTILEEQAKRMIAREVYGELENDIRDAIEIALEESFRTKEDPLMKVLDTMLLKVRGEIS